jgi:protein STE50
MLKHIKDIRSPIAVAQQKHAARQASSASVSSHETVVTQGHQKAASTSRTTHRPPKLEVQSLSTPMSSASLHPGWSEGNASLGGEQDAMIPGSASTQTSQFITSSTTASSTGPNGSAQDSTKLRPGNADADSAGGVASAREMPVPSNGVSYAVAIYPYMAEQEDEFDVVV